MSRSDVRQLSVPGRPQADPPASAPPPPEAPPEKQPAAADVVAQPAQAQPRAGALREAAPQSGICHHCQAKLSAVELKMGRCLTCGKLVAADASEAGAGSAPGDCGPTRQKFEIHI